jgi:hypothetical protein
LATIVQKNLPILIIVVTKPDAGDDPRAPGAPLSRTGDRHRSVHPRLRRLRPAFGVRSECVHTADFEAALARARGGGAALIELLTDPEALTLSAREPDPSQAPDRAGA